MAYMFLYVHIYDLWHMYLYVHISVLHVYVPICSYMPYIYMYLYVHILYESGQFLYKNLYVRPISSPILKTYMYIQVLSMWVSHTGIYGSQLYESYKLPYMCHIYFDIFETANFIHFEIYAEIHFEIYDNIFVRDIYGPHIIYVIYIYGHILDLYKYSIGPSLVMIIIIIV